MARRPHADLDALTVPKGEPTPPAQAAAPAQAPAAPAMAAHGTKMKTYAHTLSLRLSAEQYGRLRGYVREQEAATGQRFAHQTIIETALAEWLDRNGG